MQLNDVIVVGSGPAGLQAAIGAATEYPNVVVIDKANHVGGQASTSSHIENIAGYDTTGKVITRRMANAALKHGAKFILGQGVRHVIPRGQTKIVVLDNGAALVSKVVVLATGLKTKPLPIDGAATLVGRDVLYGSVLSKVRSCRDMPVVVVGGANSAGQLSQYASQTVSHVTMLVRGEDVRDHMSEYLVRRLENNPKVDIVHQAEVIKVVTHDGRLDRIEFKRAGSLQCVPACALFICIGQEPDTSWLPDEVKRDQNGFVLTKDTDLRHETEIPGVFAIGDMTSGSIKNVGGAIAQAVEVTRSFNAYIRNNKEFSLCLL